jgi:SpoVK/Ycf46/Vps4 family AAA+-type ATPase
MPDLHDLELLLRNDTPILVVETLEEQRVLQLAARLALRIGEPAYGWTVTEGLRRVDLDASHFQQELADPPEVLRHLKLTAPPGLYLLLDFHPFIDNPLHVRLVKEIAQGYHNSRRTLIFVSHAFSIPPELRHLSARFELRLPDRNRLLTLIREEAQRWQHEVAGRRVRVRREAVGQLARNLLGVTESDARRLIRSAVRDDGAITEDDVQDVTRAKYELLGSAGVVHFEYDTATFADVAGLDNLKAWLERRRSAFLGGSAVTDPPKGVMLLGVQGGGKSLAAKAVAGRFGIPLLRLDFGALYDKYYGETEKNLRRALGTADVMAPCVLWVDEIEKGISSGRDEDGVGQRVLGTLLTWMAERKSAVFLVATANDISRLPPELIRKGRLDEIFFVDLPGPEVREAILRIHLERRGLEPAHFDLPFLAAAADGFSGAGIEQAVVSAIYSSQAQERPVTTDTLLAEIEGTQPLSVVMEGQIRELRAWARDRTVPAH